LIDTTKGKQGIRQYYKKLLRRKYVVIIPFTIICILSVFVALKQKPMYQSSTTIMVGDSKLMARKLDGISVNFDTRVKLRVIRRVLLSQRSLRELVYKLDLKNNAKLITRAQGIHLNYPNVSLDVIMEKLLIDGLKKQIKITTAQDNFITISAKSDDQDKVYQLVKTISESFIDQVIESDYERLRQLIEFNAQQLKIYENKLRSSETKLRRFEQSLVPNSKNGASITSKEQLKEYKALKSIINEDIAHYRNELNILESNLGSKKFTYYLPVSENLINLESQYNGLGQKFLSEQLQSSLSSTKREEIKDEIDIVRQQISKEIRDIVNSKMNITDEEIYRLVILSEITKRDLDMVNKKRNRLNDLIRDHQVEIAQNPIHEGTLAKLEREVATNKEIYNTFLKESQGSYIGEALQKREAGYKFKIIEPAIRPIERSNSRKKVLIIGVLLGGIISISIFSLLELLDNSFSEVEEIENYLQLPVIGAIPKIDCFDNTKINKTVSASIIIATIIICIIIINY